jgi:hypothetical protein
MKIPIDEVAQDYLAYRTNNYTPAQIQEVAYSLVIEHKHDPLCSELGCCRFGLDEVNNILRKTNSKKEMGFSKVGSNGNKSDEYAIYDSRVGVKADEFKERGNTDE